MCKRESLSFIFILKVFCGRNTLPPIHVTSCLCWLTIVVVPMDLCRICKHGSSFIPIKIRSPDAHMQKKFPSLPTNTWAWVSLFGSAWSIKPWWLLNIHYTLAPWIGTSQQPHLDYFSCFVCASGVRNRCQMMWHHVMRPVCAAIKCFKQWNGMEKISTCPLNIHGKISRAHIKWLPWLHYKKWSHKSIFS